MKSSRRISPGCTGAINCSALPIFFLALSQQHQGTTAVLSSAWLPMLGGGSMKVSHVHCRVRDLPAAARWFQQVLQATPVFNNERMVWLGFGEFGVILDAASTDSALTLGFVSDDCEADYRTLTGPAAETIRATH